MRSGSTSLTRYLDDHPEVFMANPKEVGYFLHNYQYGEEWYRAHFASAGRRRAGEATPAYMVSSTAIARIRDSIPEATLVVILREPVSRVYSHYWMRRERQRESRTFREVVQFELSQVATPVDEQDVGYLGHSLYSQHLQRLLRAFPREQLHVVILEELSRDAAAIYRGLCIALGVNPDHVPLGLGRPINSYVTFRSLRVRRLARKLPKPVGRTVDFLNTKRGSEYPAIDPSIARDLTDYFEPHNQELESILGRRIKAWDRTQLSP